MTTLRLGSFWRRHPTCRVKFTRIMSHRDLAPSHQRRLYRAILANQESFFTCFVRFWCFGHTPVFEGPEARPALSSSTQARRCPGSCRTRRPGSAWDQAGAELVAEQKRKSSREGTTRQRLCGARPFRRKDIVKGLRFEASLFDMYKFLRKTAAIHSAGSSREGQVLRKSRTKKSLKS